MYKIPIIGKSKLYLEDQAKKRLDFLTLCQNCKNNYITELIYKTGYPNYRENTNTFTQIVQFFKYSPPSKHYTTHLTVPWDSLKD